MTEEPMVKRKVMVVFAHPDDAEFVAGGAIAKWAAQASVIWYVVCTDGSKGSHIENLPPGDLARRRENEQREAAAILGVKQVIFLRYSDGELEADQRLKAELVQLIRRFQPGVVLSWDPWRHYQLHSDHRASGLAAVDAVMAAAMPAHFPEHLQEGLQAHRVDEVYLFGTDNPDLWVDTSDTFAQKIAAIARHASQVADIAKVKEEIGNWNRHLGESKGFTHAEAFKVLRPHCEICR